MQMFQGHYNNWRIRRINALIDHYGVDFIRQAKILELGAGYGDIGIRLATKYGADVTCTDARQEYVDHIRNACSLINTYQLDLDQPFELPRFDLVIHWGVLYHQQATVVESSLAYICSITDKLTLETEVCDSNDPHFIIDVPENGYDQSVHNTGCRPSPAFVERVLSTAEMSFTRITDSRCNSSFHKYDWISTNSSRWRKGRRRFWFAQKETAQD